MVLVLIGWLVFGEMLGWFDGFGMVFVVVVLVIVCVGEKGEG